MSRCGNCDLYRPDGHSRKNYGVTCEGNLGAEECADNLQLLASAREAAAERKVYIVVSICDRALAVLCETTDYEKAIACLKADFQKTTNLSDEDLSDEEAEGREDEWDFSEASAWSNFPMNQDFDWQILTVDLSNLEESE